MKTSFLLEISFYVSELHFLCCINIFTSSDKTYTVFSIFNISYIQVMQMDCIIFFFLVEKFTSLGWSECFIKFQIFLLEMKYIGEMRGPGIVQRFLHLQTSLPGFLITSSSRYINSTENFYLLNLSANLGI